MIASCLHFLARLATSTIQMLCLLSKPIHLTKLIQV